MTSELLLALLFEAPLPHIPMMGYRDYLYVVEQAGKFEDWLNNLSL